MIRRVERTEIAAQRANFECVRAGAAGLRPPGTGGARLTWAMVVFGLQFFILWGLLAAAEKTLHKTRHSRHLEPYLRLRELPMLNRPG